MRRQLIFTAGLTMLAGIAAADAASAQPSASTCDIARRQGRIVPGCARAPVATPPTRATPRQRTPSVSNNVARLQPGQRRCRVSTEYAFRPCTVTAAGTDRYQLDIATGLLGLRGELLQVGEALHFTGEVSDNAPFVCTGDRSLPDYAEVMERCRAQPITFVLHRGRGGWTGHIDTLVEMRVRYTGDRPPERRAVSHELVPHGDRLEVTIQN